MVWQRLWNNDYLNNQTTPFLMRNHMPRPLKHYLATKLKGSIKANKSKWKKIVSDTMDKNVDTCRAFGATLTQLYFCNVSVFT